MTPDRADKVAYERKEELIAAAGDFITWYEAARDLGTWESPFLKDAFERLFRATRSAEATLNAKAEGHS